MPKLIPEADVRAMLARGYNRPDDEVDKAIASLPDVSGERDNRVIAMSALGVLDERLKDVLALFDDRDRQKEMGEDGLNRELLEQGLGALLNLGEAVGYGLLAVAEAVDRIEVRRSL